MHAPSVHAPSACPECARHALETLICCASRSRPGYRPACATVRSTLDGQTFQTEACASSQGKQESKRMFSRNGFQMSPAKVGRHWTGSRRSRSKYGPSTRLEFDQMLSEFGQFPPILARYCPNLAHFRSALDLIRSTSARLGSVATEFGPTSPRIGATPTGFARMPFLPLSRPLFQPIVAPYQPNRYPRIALA